MHTRTLAPTCSHLNKKVCESCSKPPALYRRLTAHFNIWIQVWDLVKTRRRARARKGERKFSAWQGELLPTTSITTTSRSPSIITSTTTCIKHRSENSQKNRFYTGFSTQGARKGGSRGTLQLRPMNAPFLLRDSCLKTHPSSLHEIFKPDSGLAIFRLVYQGYKVGMCLQPCARKSAQGRSARRPSSYGLQP